MHIIRNIISPRGIQPLMPPQPPTTTTSPSRPPSLPLSTPAPPIPSFANNAMTHQTSGIMCLHLRRGRMSHCAALRTDGVDTKRIILQALVSGHKGILSKYCTVGGWALIREREMGISERVALARQGAVMRAIAGVSVLAVG